MDIFKRSTILNFESTMSTESEAKPGVGAIEQFLLLAKTAKGAAAVELIKQVLETPGIYVFGELLDVAGIKDLANNEQFEPYLRLLNIFAFGTYSSYLLNKTNLPELTPAMVIKLRHLTIVSLAIQNKYIAYDMLLKELDMKNLRELEDLIIEVIYANVVQGKMDQRNNRLEVEQTIGRDIKSEDLKVMSKVLSDWCRNCDNVLRSIELQINNANSYKEENNRIKQQIEQQVSTIKKNTSVKNDDDVMTSDLVNSVQRETMFMEKASKRNFKNKGLRGSGTTNSGMKIWKKD